MSPRGCADRSKGGRVEKIDEFDRRDSGGHAGWSRSGVGGRAAEPLDIVGVIAGCDQGRDDGAGGLCTSAIWLNPKAEFNSLETLAKLDLDGGTWGAAVWGAGAVGLPARLDAKVSEL